MPNPLIEELLAIARAKRVTLKSLEKTSGLGDSTIRSWVNRKIDPRLFNFQCAAEALGYRVVLKRIEKEKP